MVLEVLEAVVTETVEADLIVAVILATEEETGAMEEVKFVSFQTRRSPSKIANIVLYFQAEVTAANHHSLKTILAVIPAAEEATEITITETVVTVAAEAVVTGSKTVTRSNVCELRV